MISGLIARSYLYFLGSVSQSSLGYFISIVNQSGAVRALI